MDANVVTLIAGLGGTALGGAIAALAGWWQAKRQRRWQLEDFERQQVAARDAEVRQRADAKAVEVLEHLAFLDKSLLGTNWFGRYVMPDDKDKRREVDRSLADLSRAAMYLQQPLRRHVELVADVLPDCDQLAQSFLRQSPRSLVFILLHETKEVVGKYLRNEAVPQILSPERARYAKAWDDLQEYIEGQIASQRETDGEAEEEAAGASQVTSESSNQAATAGCEGEAHPRA